MDGELSVDFVGKQTSVITVSGESTGSETLALDIDRAGETTITITSGQFNRSSTIDLSGVAGKN